MQIRLNFKLSRSRRIIRDSFNMFPPDKTGLAWTGGKDSTLLLYLVREYCLKNNIALPKIFFIDEGDTFKEVVDFAKNLSSGWNFKYITVKNTDVIKNAGKLGSMVKVSGLNAENKKELKRLGFDKKQFPFEAESFVGNHLMKTVPLNGVIRKYKLKAVFTGIRKDENPARSGEQYFSPRPDPPHTRIHPILHLTEKDVWNTIFKYKIPFVSLYRDGYRSLGARSTTHKPSDTPAWKQDLEKTKERSGRRQDKEKIMKKLRNLGYM